MLNRLNSFWLGERLGCLEQLTLVSAISVGHPVSLFTYSDKLGDVPKGVEIRDANEVMPRENLAKQIDARAYALASDFFRYQVLTKGIGYWIDLDILFIRPLDFDDEYVFGWQDANYINSAILSIPPASHFAIDLINFQNSNRRPPWYGPRRSALYFIHRVLNGDINPNDLPWGTFGPELVTYLARKHSVTWKAQKREVFYPLSYKDAKELYGPPLHIEAMIAENTRAMHLWSSTLSRLGVDKIPKGSFLDVACLSHGVETRRLHYSLPIDD